MMIRLPRRSFLLLALAACATGPAADHERVAREFVAAINARDLDALDALVATDVVRHCAATPQVVVEDLAAFKAFLRQDFVAVPDSVMEIERLFAGDDHVAMRATYRGTQHGPFGPFPPSGRELTLPFVGILRFAAGRIAEMWVEWDNLGMLVQLGHLELPAR